MEKQAIQSILTVALMAAFADGLKDEREREAIRKLADTLGADGGVDLPALYREVLLSKPKLADVVAPLGDPALRQYAYEMAVGIANADGSQNTAEGDFLARLAQALQLPAAAAESTARSASDLAAAATEPATAAPAAAATTVAASGTVLGKANVSEAELDKTIVTASITNAALELLPESLASMAIIPLQVRLVYRIGKAYGYELDSTHIKDFIATLGVGLTSPVRRAVRPQAAGRPARRAGRRHRPHGGKAGGQLRPHLCHHVRHRPRRAAVLRRRAHARFRHVEADLQRPAGRGARDGAAVPGADRAGVPDDRHP